MSNNHGRMEDLLTLRQVAAHLQVSTKTVSRLIIKLDILVLKVGNQIRVPGRCLSLFLVKKWGGLCPAMSL